MIGLNRESSCILLILPCGCRQKQLEEQRKLLKQKEELEKKKKVTIKKTFMVNRFDFGSDLSGGLARKSIR